MDVSWQNIEIDCEILASNIQEADTPYNKILCVARGGLFVGGLLAEILGIRDVSVISTRHYNHMKQLDTVEEITPPCRLPKDEKILLVDDLIDSGGTVEFILSEYQKTPMDVAVLYDKGGGDIRPKYFVEKVDREEWVTFPWEVRGD